MPQSHGQVKDVCSLSCNCMTACVDLKQIWKVGSCLVKNYLFFRRKYCIVLYGLDAGLNTILEYMLYTEMCIIEQWPMTSGPTVFCLFQGCCRICLSPCNKLIISRWDWRCKYPSSIVKFKHDPASSVVVGRKHAAVKYPFMSGDHVRKLTYVLGIKPSRTWWYSKTNIELESCCIIEKDQIIFDVTICGGSIVPYQCLFLYTPGNDHISHQNGKGWKNHRRKTAFPGDTLVSGSVRFPVQKKTFLWEPWAGSRKWIPPKMSLPFKLG